MKHANQTLCNINSRPTEVHVYVYVLGTDSFVTITSCIAKNCQQMSATCYWTSENSEAGKKCWWNTSVFW